MKALVPWLIVAVLLGGGAVWMWHLRSEAMRSERFKSKRDIMEFSTITSALRSYEMDAGFPPTTEQGLAALAREPTEPPLPKRWKEPSSILDITDRWGREYQYRQPGVHNPDTFDIWSLGQDGIPSDDDIGNWD